MPVGAIILIVIIAVIAIYLIGKGQGAAIPPPQHFNITFTVEPPPPQPLWDGPVPTEPERHENQQWLIEFFKRNPNDRLKETYPYLHQVAMASMRYDELEELRNTGRIDEIDYQIELEKILPLINPSA